MSRKSLVVILILSLVVTYGAAFTDALVNTSASKAGLPFKFGSYVLFGTARTNYSFLLLDIAFWFIVIWGVWKILQKITAKR